MPYSVARALVGQRWAPPTSGCQMTGSGAPGYVRACACHHENTGTSEESGIECDLNVAYKNERTTDTLSEGFADPLRDQRHSNAGRTDTASGNGLHGYTGERG